MALRAQGEDLPRRLVAVVDELARLDAADRQRLLDAVEGAIVARDPRAARPFMSWEQARELAAAGVELGNHTVSHVDLRQVSADAVVEEVTGAARRLADQAPGQPAHFAYPYGSHDAAVRDAVKAGGAASACTAKMGFVRPGGDVFQLDRVNMCSRSGDTPARFAARMLGLC